jgi:hypothetical protein
VAIRQNLGIAWWRHHSADLAYLSALIVLFGAVINAQSEKQTRQDVGRPGPVGGERITLARDCAADNRDSAHILFREKRIPG